MKVTPLSTSFVSALSFRTSPTRPLLVLESSLSFHSAFVISGRFNSTVTLPLFFIGHQAECALKKKAGSLSGGISFPLVPYVHFPVALPPSTVVGIWASATCTAGSCPSRNTCKVTMLPSSMSFTAALNSSSSPSFAFVLLHFTVVNSGLFVSSLARSCSYSAMFSGFMIVGMGTAAPTAMMVLLFFWPMSLQVVSWLPMVAASLPFIFTFGAVPLVTSPVFLQPFSNLMVPGSCM
ncbi:MAG: hypothetical protein BWY20_02453 [Spirochaetes bacterium ADurb.Bin215]|nr:MAG: hypothetical protein BWY20_02453 [Spirochaetes bacterium ADurb.Bin215]